MRRNPRIVGLAAAAAVFAGSLGACAGNDSTPKASPTTKADSSAAATTDQVTVKDFVFGPKTITVKAGSTVTWTNKDAFDHGIQIDALSVDGPKFGPVTQPATYSHQFDKPGTYPYICSVHNSMTGTIVVTN